MILALVAGYTLQWFHTYVPLFIIAGIMHPLAFGVLHWMIPAIEPVANHDSSVLVKLLRHVVSSLGRWLCKTLATITSPVESGSSWAARFSRVELDRLSAVRRRLLDGPPVGNATGKEQELTTVYPPSSSGNEICILVSEYSMPSFASVTLSPIPRI